MASLGQRELARVMLGSVCMLAASLGTGPARRAVADEPSPRPALTVRLVRPDLEGQRWLALFEGARAPHPAAALVAWKRATPEAQPRGLGKSREALIALFNPETMRELGVLDRAEVRLGFDPTDGHVRWSATVPGDDGTVAALATAIVLTDGRAEPPLDGVPVDRLGPPGAPLMATDARGVAAAGSRDDLRAALARRADDLGAWPGLASGYLLRIDPDAVGPTAPLPVLRLAEGLRASGCRRLDGRASLEGETLRVVLSGRFEGAPPADLGVDPAWLDWVPATRPVAAFALAIDGRPEAWDRAFAVADRVERADPTRVGVAPLRTRLNLIALAARVRPEADLWPLLRGVSGGVGVDQDGRLDSALLALHATDEAAAARLADRVLPALARSRAAGVEPAPAAVPGAIRPLGRLGGRPLGLTRRGATVLLGWGEVLPDALNLDLAHQPARRRLGLAWAPDEPPPQRFGALWPGRLPGLAGMSPALSAALAEAPPVVWLGRTDGDTSRDEIRWAGLRSTVRRFLDRLPMVKE